MKLINLTEKIDCVNDEIVGTYQTALREAESCKVDIEKSISKENNSIASNERNLKKAKARLNDFKSDCNQVKEKIKKLEIDTNIFEEKLNELNAIISTQKAEVDVAEQEYNESTDLSKQLNINETKIIKRVTDLRDETERTHQRLELCQTQISTIDGQVLILIFNYFFFKFLF